jgi:hypothetical protein
LDSLKLLMPKMTTKRPDFHHIVFSHFEEYGR